jgi:hypothetical protein
MAVAEMEGDDEEEEVVAEETNECNSCSSKRQKGGLPEPSVQTTDEKGEPAVEEVPMAYAS